MEPSANPPAGRMVRRALQLRCPVCSTGGLFGPRKRPLLGLPTRCEGCGLVFARESGHWTGSWGLNVIVSFTALFAVLIIGIAVSWPDPPGWPLAVAAVGVALLTPLLFAPWSATLWLVIDLLLRPLTPGEQRTVAAHRTRDDRLGGDRRGGRSGARHHEDGEPHRERAASQPPSLEGGETGEHAVEHPAR